MNIPDCYFEESNRILDVGGWFLPEPRATHVVDLMPWETRRGRLSLIPLAGEKFSKATWFQADFLGSDFRLPFEDKSFDLVLCGHTVEDLADPAPILREMQRVGIRGIIECPSRIAEQTTGIDGRESTLPGYHHHHWIVESTGDSLLLYSKKDSELKAKTRSVPLLLTEKRITLGLDSHSMIHNWHDKIVFSFVSGTACQKRAEELVEALNISEFVRVKDHLLRSARRARTRLKGKQAVDSTWWPKIVELSRPFSGLDLH
jgi:SAM-dependent methyltransferase